MQLPCPEKASLPRFAALRACGLIWMMLAHSITTYEWLLCTTASKDWNAGRQTELWRGNTIRSRIERKQVYRTSRLTQSPKFISKDEAYHSVLGVARTSTPQQRLHCLNSWYLSAQSTSSTPDFLRTRGNTEGAWALVGWPIIITCCTTEVRCNAKLEQVGEVYHMYLSDVPGTLFQVVRLQMQRV